MRILGIDPGLATIGFSILETNGNKYRLVNCGVISTPAHHPLSDRLGIIFNDLNQLIDAYHPDAVSVEELFFNTNLTTGIQVAHARGVILLVCHQHDLKIFEYTPLQVKDAVVGYGRADKHQVMEMVRRLCGLQAPPKPDDAADAVALALCHARSTTSILYKGESDKSTT